MSGFLDHMAAASRLRLEEARTREPLTALRTRVLATPQPPPLILRNRFNLIAEFKRRSPALGRLGDADLESRVTAYAEGGAATVSVVTEPTQFHGNLDHLAAAAELLTPLGIPVMRKDFLVDPYQLHEARAAGAGGVLLIIRMLSGASLAEMLDCARELTLFVLLECFDGEDIARATAEVAVGVPERSIKFPRSEGTPRPDPGRGAPAVLFGVNCRDLQTLAVTPGRFHEMAPLLPGGVVHVAESGITTPDDCADVARDGYELALVGSALMTASDPAAVIRTMLAAGRAAA
ncbi:MAG: indole-3-glycerol phosphate synthase [Steroidobacteraceae bacterium]|nr:indole-3-glycerol phosphate synthase [Steroidobacteraceae bacterium]MBM2853344.1 indole-3-glycerol phosphate synthase [Steroidobacteraceae bacterium]